MLNEYIDEFYEFSLKIPRITAFKFAESAMSWDRHHAMLRW